MFFQISAPREIIKANSKFNVQSMEIEKKQEIPSVILEIKIDSVKSV